MKPSDDVVHESVLKSRSFSHPGRQRRGLLGPNAEMWEALGEGPGLRAVLEDFYTRVYADERLAPFFEAVPKERAIQKQYAFMSSLFTGEATYMGDRPRNAHHWMVISDDLFDHREKLMEEALRRFGLREDLVRTWLAIDELYRKQIVKRRPRPRRVSGVQIDYPSTVSFSLEVASLCDGCGTELGVGAIAFCRPRTGRMLCSGCSTTEDVR